MEKLVVDKELDLKYTGSETFKFLKPGRNLRLFYYIYIIMSTRTILKERRNFFKMQMKHDFNESAKKVVNEIDFILEKLRSEYDKHGYTGEKKDRINNGEYSGEDFRI